MTNVVVSLNLTDYSGIYYDPNQYTFFGFMGMVAFARYGIGGLVDETSSSWLWRARGTCISTETMSIWPTWGRPICVDWLRSKALLTGTSKPP